MHVIATFYQSPLSKSILLLTLFFFFSHSASRIIDEVFQPLLAKFCKSLYRFSLFFMVRMLAKDELLNFFSLNAPFMRFQHSSSNVATNMCGCSFVLPALCNEHCSYHYNKLQQIISQRVLKQPACCGYRLAVRPGLYGTHACSFFRRAVLTWKSCFTRGVACLCRCHCAGAV